MPAHTNLSLGLPRLRPHSQWPGHFYPPFLVQSCQKTFKYKISLQLLQMPGQSLSLKPLFASRHPVVLLWSPAGFCEFNPWKNQLLCPHNWKNREYNKNTQRTPYLGSDPILLWVQTTSCCPMAAKRGSSPFPWLGEHWHGADFRQAPPPAGNWAGTGAGEAGGGHRAAPVPASPRHTIHIHVSSIS